MNARQTRARRRRRVVVWPVWVYSGDGPASIGGDDLGDTGMGEARVSFERFEDERGGGIGGGWEAGVGHEVVA